MNLLRRRHGGYWLALFAMALQFTFSFGHFHGAQYHVDGKFLSAVETLFIQVTHDDSYQHQDNEQDKENCPTCWTLTAAGSFVLPVIVVLPQPIKSVYAHQFANNTASFFSLRAQPYQVRAPPFAPIV